MDHMHVHDCEACVTACRFILCVINHTQEKMYTGPILEFPIILEVRKCAGHIGIKFPLYDLHLIYGILMHISLSAG